MHFLVLVCTCWVLIANAIADMESASTNLFQDNSLDRTLFTDEQGLSFSPSNLEVPSPPSLDAFVDDSLDPVLLTEQNNIAELDRGIFSSYQMEGPSSLDLAADPVVDDSTLFTDFNLISDNNIEPNQSIGLVQSSSLANDVACVTSNTDATPSFLKTRRGNACQTPRKKGQGGQGGQEGQGSGNEPNQDDFGFQRFINSQLGGVDPFPESDELCPAKVFPLSRIPVCSDPLITSAVQTPPHIWVNLFDVFPLVPLTNVCPQGYVLWCCAQVSQTETPPEEKPSTTDETIAMFSQWPLEAIAYANIVRNYDFDATVCWSQRLAQFGVTLQ